ncbi:MAG: amidohydrolase family protein [Thermoanaerobaculia bacterium]
MRRLSLGVALAMACLAGGARAGRGAAPPTPPPASPAIALVGGALIDLDDFGRSTHDLADAVVVIVGDRVVAAGARGTVAIPTGARIVDAAGTWILPGLVDGFAGMNSQAQANAYLYLGVTSIVGVEDARRGHLDRSANPAPNVYPLMAIGYPEAADAPPLDDAGAIASLERAAASGARVALLMYPNPPARIGLLVARARALGVATIGELGRTSYEEAIALGVQAFVHTSRYSLPLAPEPLRTAVAEQPFGPPKAQYYRYLVSLPPGDPRITAWADRLGGSGVALLPTLAMEYLDLPGHANPWLEPVARILDPAGIHLPAERATGERLGHPESGPDAFPGGLSTTLLALERRYHAAGARYLAGSGTSAFGTMPGISLHHELGLLVETGSTARQALAAATRNFRAVFGWREIGCLEAGCRADLVLVEADPTLDLANLKRIRSVWLAGQALDRESLLAGAPAPPPRQRP